MINKINQNIETLLVLGGDKDEDIKRRSECAFQYYNLKKEKNIRNNKNQEASNLNIILSGKEYGFNAANLKITEAELMRDYLIKKGIPTEDMYLETEALDTLGNMAFSREIVDNLNSKEINIITDAFHMKRSMWAAKRIFGNNYEINPLPTNYKGTLVERIIEIGVLNAWKFDLRNIKNGDIDEFKRYINERNLMYNKNAKLGLYNIGLSILKKINER
jgi:uncharacterized SAM-binding protein YcdF (DUF218 family)